MSLRMEKKIYRLGDIAKTLSHVPAYGGKNEDFRNREFISGSFCGNRDG